MEKSFLSKLRNIERYRAQVDNIYEALNEESAALGINPDTETPEGTFSIENYPKTTKFIDELISTYKSDVSNGKVNPIVYNIKRYPSTKKDPIEQIFEDRGVAEINIEAFIKEYMANIPIDFYIQLSNLRYKQGYTSTEIPLSLYEDIKKRKQEKDLIDKRITQTAEANNEGMAFEKSGAIDKAIERYEWNIYENHCEALHSFQRLIVLYGKRKDEDNKRRILEKGIEVFKNRYPDIAENYRSKLSSLISPPQHIYPIKAEHHTHNGLSLQDRFEEEQWTLPEFEFCSGFEKYGLSDSPRATKTMFEIRKKYNSILYDAKNNEIIGRYDLAAPLYETLVDEGYPFPLPYEKLLTIYTKAKLNDDVRRILEKGIQYFSIKRKNQFEYVDTLAKKYGAEDFLKARLAEGKKIQYYFGMFDLYNPYPCVEKFQSRLIKLKQK